MCKGQIKPKAGLAHSRFSQNVIKQIWFVCCKKQKSKQNKFVRSFVRKIYGAPICFRFYLTFRIYSPQVIAFLLKKGQQYVIFNSVHKAHMYKCLGFRQWPLSYYYSTIPNEHKAWLFYNWNLFSPTCPYSELHVY